MNSASAASAAAPLAFRQDDPIAFPVAGAALLAVLVVVAAVLWWLRRRSVSPTWVAGLSRIRRGHPGAPVVECSVPLDTQTRLHVVRWNDHDLLIAASASTSPVVLDRRSHVPTGDGPASGARS